MALSSCVFLNWYPPVSFHRYWESFSLHSSCAGPHSSCSTLYWSSIPGTTYRITWLMFAYGWAMYHPPSTPSFIQYLIGLLGPHLSGCCGAIAKGQSIINNRRYVCISTQSTFQIGTTVSVSFCHRNQRSSKFVRAVCSPASHFVARHRVLCHIFDCVQYSKHEHHGHRQWMLGYREIYHHDSVNVCQFCRIFKVHETTAATADN